MSFLEEQTKKTSKFKSFNNKPRIKSTESKFSSYSSNNFSKLNMDKLQRAFSKLSPRFGEYKSDADVLNRMNIQDFQVPDRKAVLSNTPSKIDMYITAIPKLNCTSGFSKNYKTYNSSITRKKLKTSDFDRRSLSNRKKNLNYCGNSLNISIPGSNSFAPSIKTPYIQNYKTIEETGGRNSRKMANQTPTIAAVHKKHSAWDPKSSRLCHRINNSRREMDTSEKSFTVSNCVYV